MKTIGILIFAAGLFTFSSCEELIGESEAGKGPLVKKTIKVSGFDEIEVSSAMQLFVRQGDKTSVVVKGHNNVLKRLNAVVRSGRLEFELESGNFRNLDLRIYVTMPNVKYIGGSGATEVKMYSFSHLNELALDFSGASEFEAVGKITPIDRFLVDISGAGEIQALNLKAKNVSLDVSGASSCEVYATEKLNLDLSGASEVRYKGKPKVSQDISGASSVETVE